jgi:hypothetical protein
VRHELYDQRMLKLCLRQVLHFRTLFQVPLSGSLFWLVLNEMKLWSLQSQRTDVMISELQWKQLCGVVGYSTQWPKVRAFTVCFIDSPFCFPISSLVWCPHDVERAATIPMVPKNLRSLPTFSFLSEVDSSLLIRECCIGPEFTYGEIIIAQVGTLLLSHPPQTGVRPRFLPRARAKSATPCSFLRKVSFCFPTHPARH